MDTDPAFTPGVKFSKSNPIEYALSIDLILKEIFKHCVAGKDRKSLLAVRAVCRKWGKDAKSILYDFIDLMPAIKISRGQQPWELPGWGLPLNLEVDEWTREVVQLLTQRANDIGAIKLIIFYGAEDFSLREEDSFMLRNLRQAKFEFGLDRENYNYSCQMFKNSLLLFKDIIKATRLLTKCEVSLPHRWEDQIDYMDKSLVQLPTEMTSLKLLFDSLDRMARCQRWPNLNSLHLMMIQKRKRNESVSVSTYLNENGSQIRNLTLECNNPHIRYAIPVLELPLLNNLTRLTLRNVAVRGGNQLPTLIPQLKSLKIDSDESTDTLSSLTSSNLAYTNVTSVVFSEPDAEVLPVPPETVSRAAGFTKSFPNLVKLAWQTEDENFHLATSVIYANLMALKYLKILADFRPGQLDIVKLITGLAQEEIPEDQVTWRNTLHGKKNAITNLKYLEDFSMQLQGTAPRRAERIPQRQSKFLFQAAFMKMKNLKLVHLGNVTLNKKVMVEWRKAGRICKTQQFDKNDELEFY